jgi:hypothetical protein
LYKNITIRHFTGLAAIFPGNAAKGVISFWDAPVPAKPLQNRH